MPQNHALAIFLVLLLLSSGAGTALAFATGAGSFPLLLLMWSVGLAAMAALKFSGHTLDALGWQWGPAKYHVIAVALPLGYCVVGYGAAGLSGLVLFPSGEKMQAMVQALHFDFLSWPLSMIAALALIATAGLLQTMTSALGEEIGWRGFLAPRLIRKLGFAGGSLLTGLIWAMWHVPLILVGGYNGGGDPRLEIPSFIVMVVSMSAALSWLRLKAQSLWPCVTMHAVHNLLVQGIFDRLVTRQSGGITLVGEFGILFAATALLFSLPFWRMGRGQSAPQIQSAN